MTSSGAAWDARYQYLAGGVNTPNNWKTWQDTSLPPGQFVLDYMSESSANGYTPVLTWYQMAQSLPGTGSSEDVKNYNNLNNASTMKSYFSDFKLLLDKAKAFGKPVIIHVEPDLWGFLQQRSTNPNSISASVASSGYSDVAGYANTVSGFAQALVGLRNKYAPNALLAYHISEWASSYGDVGTSPDANFNVSGAAQQIANFYVQTGANFDLMFYDPSDRDAALYASWGDPYHWWDVNNTTYPNFNRFHQFISLVTSETNKRGMLWQVPIGNTLYRSMNNTQQHWQDNRVQYYLNDTTNKHLQDLANSGVVGILFGAGDGNTTSYGDGAGDGITNPAPINGNTLVASYSDDDGGNLRLQAKAYYTRGRLYFSNPTLNAVPASGSTVTISTNINTAASSTISFSNIGSNTTILTISVLVISGSGASVFSITSNTALNLTGGAPSQTVTIQCNPTGARIFNATLNFTTNDPTKPNVSYNLVCNGLAPKFSSAPYLPGSTISLAGQANIPISLTLGISNAGSSGTTLMVNSATLTQTNPGVITASPATAFNQVQGASAHVVTITCTPPTTGVDYSGTITFPITNDPILASVVYTIVCKALTPLQVVSSAESGLGTLYNALTTYTPNQTIIVFAAGINKINVNASHPLVANLGPVIIDGGGCSNGQPTLTIDGMGMVGDGLTLSGGVQLRNIRIKGFTGKQLVVLDGKNKIGNCIVISRN